MQLSTTHTIYTAMMTQRLTAVSGTARAETAETIGTKTEVAKIGMMQEARAIGASAIINMRVSVQTEPHGYKVTASGDGATLVPATYEKVV